MPYITDKTKIDDAFIDKRVKLLPCQREMIHYLHDKGSSINSLARLFKVSKRLVQFELFPERKKKNLADRELRGGAMQYYNREKHNEYMRKHRQHKYNVLKESLQFENQSFTSIKNG